MIRRNTIVLLLITAMLFPLILHGQAPEKKTTPQEYIDRYKVIAIKKRIEYKIPASITLAQGLLESGNGNSPLAVNANNHFGIKCHLGWTGDTYHQDDDAKDECFRKYNNPEESFDDHSLFLTSRSRYDFLFEYKVTEYKLWAKGLKKAGYATNPKYAHLLINLIERYGLDKYDTMSLQEAKASQKEKPNEHLIAKKDNPTKKPEAKKASEKDKKDFKKVKEPGNSYVSTSQLVVKMNNRIKYVIAREDDTPESIAEELDMWAWQIERYNELNSARSIEAGKIVYLQPKRRKAEEKYHTVQKGEDMYSISQKYGIKLKHLYKKNNMEPGSQPKTGQKLWLRRNKPEH